MTFSAVFNDAQTLNIHQI